MRIPSRLRPLAALLALSGGLAPCALAQTAPASLADVMVTATRSTQAAEPTSGTVTAIDRQEIERRLPADIADLFAGEPDISITSNTVRFGTGAINIRGIEDNRVLLLIDGVRAADLRSPGSTNYTGSNRDLPEPDFLKRVEVVRGPGSSLYGSDAIGGVVGFLTLDPEDFLKAGARQVAGARLTYSGENAGIKGTGWFAASSGPLKGLLMLSRSDARQTDNAGTRNVFGLSRTTPNPQEIRSTSVLAKLAFTPALDHEFRLALELKEKQTDTDAQRIANYNPRSPTALTRITQNRGDDSLSRQRLALDYIHTPKDGWYDRLNAKFFWQRQESENANYQRRANASLNATWGCSSQTAGAGNCDVNQRFEFSQAVIGASAVLEKAVNGAVPHFLTWGADLQRTLTQERKNTTWTNLATGAVSNRFIGETYPLSEYPKGHVDQLGVFAQDDIHFLDGRLRVTPGLRHDQFKLQPQSDDPDYHPAAGRAAVAKSGSRLSPKLAAAFEVLPHTVVHGQYVEGFRAPSYEEVNRYFSNNQVNYALSGNPNLRPETSKGLEFGLRAGNAGLNGALSVFHNRYDDFIESVLLTAGDPAIVPGFQTHQFRNLTDVAIHGYELRGAWQALRDLTLSAAYAYARGEYESASGVKQPLNSVEPRRLTLAALWTPRADLGLEARLRAAARQSRVDDTASLASTNTPVFRVGGYAVVDLAAWWQARRDTRVNVAIRNLFDRKYWQWSTARNLNAGDLGPEFHTEPQRSILASVTVDF